MKHLSDNQLDFYERLIKVSGAVATTIVIPIVDELREQLSENARLRKAIEDSDHECDCKALRWSDDGPFLFDDRACTCIKAKALGDGDHNGTI